MTQPPATMDWMAEPRRSSWSQTNFAGGTTSAKVSMPDPLTGEETEALWVKGSGGDLGSMGMDGFATLYLDKLLALETLYRGIEHEDRGGPLLSAGGQRRDEGDNGDQQGTEHGENLEGNNGMTLS